MKYLHKLKEIFLNVKRPDSFTSIGELCPFQLWCNILHKNVIIRDNEYLIFREVDLKLIIV